MASKTVYLDAILPAMDQEHVQQLLQQLETSPPQQPSDVEAPSMPRIRCAWCGGPNGS